MTNPPVTKRKAFAYITQGERLLIFSHPFAPEAGLQVPAGSIEPGEEPAAAALREATEETGLTGLTLVGFLGEQVRDMRDYDRNEIHHRYFYHLTCDSATPAVWRHGEFTPSDSSGPHIFEFFWVRLPNEVPELIADHGYFLPTLLEKIADLG